MDVGRAHAPSARVTAPVHSAWRIRGRRFDAVIMAFEWWFTVLTLHNLGGARAATMPG